MSKVNEAIDALKTHLTQITIANGFSSDLGLNVAEGWAAHLLAEDIDAPCLIIQVDKEEAKQSGVSLDATLHIQLVVTSVVDAAVTAKHRAMIRDLRRQLCQAHLMKHNHPLLRRLTQGGANFDGGNTESRLFFSSLELTLPVTESFN